MTERLLRGFSDSEAERIRVHLEKLLPHLIIDQIVIVGGLAIRYYLTLNNIPFSPPTVQ